MLNIEENLNNNKLIIKDFQNKYNFKQFVEIMSFTLSSNFLLPFFCDKFHSATQMIAKIRIKSTEYFCSFLLLRNIPFYMRTTSLSIHLSIDI